MGRPLGQRTHGRLAPVMGGDHLGHESAAAQEWPVGGALGQWHTRGVGERKLAIVFFAPAARAAHREFAAPSDRPASICPTSSRTSARLQVERECRKANATEAASTTPLTARPSHRVPVCPISARAIAMATGAVAASTKAGRKMAPTLRP
jgi:hypothetical protein